MFPDWFYGGIDPSSKYGTSFFGLKTSVETLLAPFLSLLKPVREVSERYVFLAGSLGLFLRRGSEYLVTEYGH